MNYTYVLFSRLLKQFYIGSTHDLKKRFASHISGLNKSTKETNDWEIIYYEAYTSYKMAYRREMSLKKRSKAWQMLKVRIFEDKR